VPLLIHTHDAWYHPSLCPTWPGKTGWARCLLWPWTHHSTLFQRTDRGSAAGYWPASLRSLTFLQRRSQALDVELRSCSLKERRSFRFAEFLLEVIANPPLGHNNTILFVPQQTGCVTVSDRKAPVLSRGDTLSFYCSSSRADFGSRSSNAVVNILGTQNKYFPLT